MAFQNRNKFCYFKENGINEVDYKDVKLLRRFVNDHYAKTRDRYKC